MAKAPGNMRNLLLELVGSLKGCAVPNLLSTIRCRSDARSSDSGSCDRRQRVTLFEATAFSECAATCSSPLCLRTSGKASGRHQTPDLRPPYSPASDTNGPTDSVHRSARDRG